MRLLLDTHIALWAITLDAKLSASARALITDPQNDVFVSVVSLWEIAIKRNLARGAETGMPVSSARALELFRLAGYLLLNVAPAHAIFVEKLPRLHRDPFDRILVAQALSEPLRLLTRDPQVACYSDLIIQV